MPIYLPYTCVAYFVTWFLYALELYCIRFWFFGFYYGKVRPVC